MTRRSLLWTVVLTLALALCGLSAWRLHLALTDEDTAFARARDSALADGRDHIARLNSVDSTRIDADIDAWLDATTGPLRNDYDRLRAQHTAELTKAGTTMSAQVTDAALTSLDDRAGTARLIATVRVEATSRGGGRSTDRKRFEAVLARTGDGWKLTSLSAVAAGGQEDPR
ncbi:hypothetical protein NX801_08660 [Streptomyces sp. LP05-1]|uniref:Mce-associated membrane protein n=1 Tax=Streptomyces pyxinae TaxID=2970734 RepID=A0ABT2CE90_9ACTN|nr:hypothetical protein [Streptomyces sp. LP05-1]MCS0635733.1 hypothetical protein [Streptomyces sp. LP05-1]